MLFEKYDAPLFRIHLKLTIQLKLDGDFYQNKVTCQVLLRKYLTHLTLVKKIALTLDKDLFDNDLLSTIHYLYDTEESETRKWNKEHFEINIQEWNKNVTTLAK